MRRRLDARDWEQAQREVRPFLECERDLALVTPAVLVRLLADH